MISSKELKSKLHSQIETVAKRLLPGGKKQGNLWVAGSKRGEIGSSLKLELSEPKIGLWHDFATGEGGDLIDLWAEIFNLSFVETLKDIASYLGITSPQLSPASASHFEKPKVIKVAAGKALNYLTEERKLTKDVIDKFKVSLTDDKIIFPYYQKNEILLYKFLDVERIDGKKNMTTTPKCKPILFGWQAVNKKARKLVLTEGEIDAMTLDQYGLADLGYAILSIPYGGGSGNKHLWLEHEYDNISKFEEILFCFDNDKTGHETVKYLEERLIDHLCRNVVLPHKDANECLQEGLSPEKMIDCFEKAQRIDPIELKSAGYFTDIIVDIFNGIRTAPKGYRLPWDKVEDKFLFTNKRYFLWTGINGHGKSQIIGQIIISFINQGASICLASLELSAEDLLERLVLQATGMTNPSSQYVREVMTHIKDKLFLYDVVGSTDSDRLLEIFKYTKNKYGVDVFFIDSLAMCNIDDTDLDGQKRFILKLCKFKHQYNCQVHLLAHPKKIEGGESSIPSKMDVKGNGAISDLSDMCLSVWRNKAKEKKIIEAASDVIDKDLLHMPDCVISCDKNRHKKEGWEGKINLWFNKDCCQYLESPNQKPINMVKFSTRNLEQKEENNVIPIRGE